MSWQPKVSLVILISVFAFSAAISLGKTWVRFKLIKIGDRFDVIDGTYCLPITNHGFGEEKIAVNFLAIEADSGPIQDSEKHMPVELRWHRCKNSDKPALANGITRRVQVFRTQPHAKASGIVYKHELFLTLNVENDASFATKEVGSSPKIWLHLSFGSASVSRWYSIQSPATHQDEFIVKEEYPPSLGPTFFRKLLASIRKMLGTDQRSSRQGSA